MGATITVNASTVSTGLLPILHATPWRGHIAAVFQRSLLLSAPDGRLVHLRTGPQLASPFSLRLESTWVRVLHVIPLSRGMSVRLMGTVVDIAGRLRLELDGVAYYRSPRPSARAVDARASAPLLAALPPAARAAAPPAPAAERLPEAARKNRV